MKPKGIKKIRTDRILNMVERYGNRLPQPISLFLILSLIVVIGSHLAVMLGAEVILPQMDAKTGEMKEVLIQSRSLLSADGIRFMFEGAITNFTGFAPVGVVLVSVFGVAAAEGSGLLKALIKRILYSVDGKFITAMIVFLGVMSNIASDAGYVVVLPIGALIFKNLGRNPLAGIAAGFAGVSGGFSANLLIGSIDPLLGSLSTIGARIINPNYTVSPTANYYFMFVSTFLIVIVGTFVTEKIVEPRLGKEEISTDHQLEPFSVSEKRGLRFALIAFVLTMIAIGIFVFPEHGILRNQVDGNILTDSPFINSIVIIITLLFFVPGVFYGIGAGTVKSDKDLLASMEGLINTMGGYLLLTFIGAQFVAYFRYSNLGTIIAVRGAVVLESTGITGLPLLVIWIVIVAFINLFIGSAITKWSIMAPVFIPMFFMLGISPELTQLAYRIGDSSTNIISPLMPFFGIVLTIAQGYKKDIGIGTIMSMMLPYSFYILVTWTLFFLGWILLGIPIGPGVVPFL